MAEKNAPVKIWATPTRETFKNATWDRGEFYEDERQADGLGVQYVRADIADKLIEALEIIAGKRPCLDNLMGNADIALAALAALSRHGEGKP